jgi:hypothetical protein
MIPPVPTPPQPTPPVSAIQPGTDPYTRIPAAPAQAQPLSVIPSGPVAPPPAPLVDPPAPIGGTPTYPAISPEK